MVMPYHLHMPSYFLETFTEYPYPIVSCRGRVCLPEDTKQTVFGRANLAPTNETTALSTF